MAKNINIERNVKINHENKTIEITKQFKAAACRFGTKEYKAIKDAVADHPNYRVVERKTSKKKVSYKGLTFDFMEKYISSHDDEENSIMTIFLELRGLSDEALALNAESSSYSDIKAWFFNQFPEIEAFQIKRENIININKKIA